MYRSRSNRIFPIILIIVVMIAVIAGLITVARYLFFSGGSDEPDESQVVTARDRLLTLSTDRTVRITVRGAIVGDDEFRTERIAISPNSRDFTIYNGYLDNIEEQKSYDNNMEAYEEFVYALDKAEFTTPGEMTPSEASDIRGICATGRVYEFEIVGSTGVLERMWTSTCKGSPGTFGASLSQVVDLFTAQIPEDTLLPVNRGGFAF